MKSFLTNNKIYFETIATLTLTVMALVVSMKANSIAEYSAMLSKIDHLPHVSAEFKLEEDKSGAKSEYLIIQNSGEVMYQFKAQSFAFLDLRELKLMVPGEADRPSDLKKALIPLGNVFSNISYTSDENEGLISKLPIRDGNNLDEAISKFSSEQSSDNRSFHGSVERYLLVSYIDKFGDTHNQFFKFSPFGTSIPMTDRLGEQLLSKHNQFSEKGQLLDYVSGTKADLIEYWKRLSKERIVLN